MVWIGQSLGHFFLLKNRAVHGRKYLEAKIAKIETVTKER